MDPQVAALAGLAVLGGAQTVLLTGRAVKEFVTGSRRAVRDQFGHDAELARAKEAVADDARLQNINMLAMIAPALARLAENTDAILAAVTPNHGESLRDAVNRTESQMAVLARDHIRYNEQLGSLSELVATVIEERR